MSAASGMASMRRSKTVSPSKCQSSFLRHLLITRPLAVSALILSLIIIACSYVHYLKAPCITTNPLNLKDDEIVHITGTVLSITEKESYQAIYVKETKSGEVILICDDSFTGILIGNVLDIHGFVSLFESATNTGCFDSKLYYLSRETACKVSSTKITVLDNKRSPVKDYLYRFRKALLTLLDTNMDASTAGSLKAILLGDKTGMDEDTKELFQTNGIGHILAISGLHLSFIGVGVYRFFRKRTGSFLIGGILGISFLSAYILMIGLTISALRALVMFFFRVGADLCGRKYDAFTALSVALLVVLLWHPYAYFDGGFWLSFLAVLGILLLTPLKIPAGISIQLMLFPVILYYFFELPTYSVLLNMWVIPLMSILLAFGIEGLILLYLGSSSPSLLSHIAFRLGPLLQNLFLRAGRLLLLLCHYILALYEAACRLILRLPLCRLVLGKPSVSQIFLYYLALGIAICIFNVNKYHSKEINKFTLKDIPAKSRRLTASFVIAAALLLPIHFHSLFRLQVSMIDVGQGDSVFVRSAEGSTYLIDGGSSSKKNVGQYVIEPFLLANGTGTLDYVFVSHGDEDHMNGIEEMLERQNVGVRIKALVFPAETVWDDTLLNLSALALKNGTEVYTLNAGGCVGNIDKERFTCIQPQDDFPCEAGNEASMVLSLTYGDFDMLFTGDIEGEGEELLTQNIIRSYADTSWEVLKVAHHGSKGSSSDSFLKTVNPSYALISAGENNRYGHPHKETVQRLADNGADIYCTIENGEIDIYATKRNFKFN